MVYHTPSIILKFQMENPLFTWYFFHDLWRVSIFLPPKRPWSTGHPLRRSIELSPTDRENKHPWGRGNGSWCLVKVKVILIWNLTGMFAWTVTPKTPKIQRTPYYAFLISARVHLNFGECGVKKQHSIQYCECPDRSCFVWSNKANVVYLVMLLVGQHIAAEKYCKSIAKAPPLFTCCVLVSITTKMFIHYTSKKQICFLILHILWYNVSWSRSMVVASTFQVQGEVHVIVSPVLWKPPAFVWLPSLTGQTRCGFGWGKAMPACLSGWRLSEPSRGPEKRNTTSQRSDVSQGIYVQIEIAKHQNTNQLRKKYQIPNNKTRTYWSSSSLYIYLSRFYFTMMISIFHYIKWSKCFLISWSRISATILTLTLESFQYLLATCYACQQLLTFFLPKRGTIEYIFLCQKCLLHHSKETWNTFGNGLLDLTTVPTAQHGLCFCGVTFHIVGLCLRCTGG